MTPAGGAPPRIVDVAPERWERWAAGFAERHDGATADTGVDGALRLTGGDGAVAEQLPWAAERAEATPPQRIGFVLLRRGGYALGASEGPTLTAHQCGTRYVQSRTAAGGWSQQRFARRRAGQADALVQSVVEKASSVLGQAHDRLEGLAVGGDKALVAQVLELEGMRVHLPRVVDLPRRTFFDIPDPRLAVLQKVLARARAIRVAVTDPA